MTGIRTVPVALAVALVAGVTGVAATAPPASAAPPARHAAAGRPMPAAALTGATALTLSNGTRVAVAAPWAAAMGHAGVTGRVRSFAAASGGGAFCFYGVLQTARPEQAVPQ